MAQTSRQRRDEILKCVLERGHATVRDLAGSLDVSEATVRRDLRRLADLQEVELVYGGATVPRTTDLSFQSKAMRNVEAKRVIGRLAADLVPDGGMVFIDSGTTCYEMRHHLRRKRSLTIIVNSARLAVDLVSAPDSSLILLGGRFRPDRMDTIGPLAIDAIDQMRGYVAFIGADGVGMDFGVTASDLETAHLYQHVLRNARESILVVDHQKFLSPSLFRIAELDAVSRVVTDQPPPGNWEEHLNARGIELIYPGREPAEEPANGES